MEKHQGSVNPPSPIISVGPNVTDIGSAYPPQIPLKRTFKADLRSVSVVGATHTHRLSSGEEGRGLSPLLYMGHQTESVLHT